MTRPSNPNHHINPRVRAFGKARLDIARRAQTRQDWDSLWKKPQYAFPFTWGAYWKQCIEYRVEDYAAEVGFFIDILGLPVNAFNEYTAMFTGPNQEFYFAVTPTFEGQQPTPPDALRLQFFVADIFQVAQELEQRGIVFEQPPQPVTEGSNYYVGYFRTPHGICVDLCGLVDTDQLAEPTEAEPSEAQEVESGIPGEEDEIEPFPAETAEKDTPLGQDPDDVFVEVHDQPARSTTQSSAYRQNAPPQNRPASPPQSPQQTRFQPAAPRPAQTRTDTPAQQPQQPPPIEPTYEPLEDNPQDDAPAQPPSQPRSYRAISFGDEHFK